MKKLVEKIKAVMIGHAIGDALGVSVEFCSREELVANPVTDMRGYGTYPVPAGSWSDDKAVLGVSLGRENLIKAVCGDINDALGSG